MGNDEPTLVSPYGKPVGELDAMYAPGAGPAFVQHEPADASGASAPTPTSGSAGTGDGATLMSSTEIMDHTEDVSEEHARILADAINAVPRHVADPGLAWRMLGHSTEVLTMLLGIQRTASFSTHELEAAFERDNLPEIEHVAHRLVGRLSYLHAKPTVAAAHELERYCKFTRPCDKTRVAELIAALRERIDELVEAMRVFDALPESFFGAQPGDEHAQ